MALAEKLFFCERLKQMGWNEALGLVAAVNVS
jgi:hypothetical protein